MGSIFCYFFCWVWWVLYPAKLCFQAIFLPFSKYLKSALRLGFQALCHIFDMIPLNTMNVFLSLTEKKPWLFIYDHHLYKLYKVLKFLNLKCISQLGWFIYFKTKFYIHFVDTPRYWFFFSAYSYLQIVVYFVIVMMLVQI